MIFLPTKLIFQKYLVDSSFLKAIRPSVLYVTFNLNSLSLHFRLRAEDDMGWVQRPSAFEFQSLLSNLTAIKIRATYSDRG